VITGDQVVNTEPQVGMGTVDGGADVFGVGDAGWLSG
jgi:hypothetical protein